MKNHTLLRCRYLGDFLSHVEYSQRVLHWFEKKIQCRLNQLSDNDIPTIRQKTADSGHSRNEDLIIL